MGRARWRKNGRGHRLPLWGLHIFPSCYSRSTQFKSVLWILMLGHRNHQIVSGGCVLQWKQTTAATVAKIWWVANGVPPIRCRSRSGLLVVFGQRERWIVVWEVPVIMMVLVFVDRGGWDVLHFLEGCLDPVLCFLSDQSETRVVWIHHGCCSRCD